MPAPTPSRWRRFDAAGRRRSGGGRSRRARLCAAAAAGGGAAFGAAGSDAVQAAGGRGWRRRRGAPRGRARRARPGRGRSRELDVACRHRGRLKPKVLETFDTIADTFKRLRRLQEIDIQNKLSNEKLSLSPNQERKYRKLKEEIIQEVKSLRLNQARQLLMLSAGKQSRRILYGVSKPRSAHSRAICNANDLNPGSS